MSKKIDLYLCPVCEHANHDACSERSEITEAQKECAKFSFKGTAEFIFYADCPGCLNGGGMLYQDKFGAACAVNGCTFRQDYPQEVQK